MTGTAGEKAKEQSGLRIVIADDHALVRGGLALLIDMASPGAEVLHANSLGQVTDILSQKGAINLLLLDLMMPGMEGEAGLKTICSSWPDVPVIIVSVKEDIHSIRQCLAAGAMGYLPKTSRSNIIVSAIRLVLEGGIYIPPHVLQLDKSQSDHNLNPPGSVSENALTRRQLQVLELIESGKSNKAIAGELGLSTGTVKMHVSGIFKKLNIASRTEAVAVYSRLKKSIGQP